MHRLDACVSGALVLARNADAASWLAQAFRAKEEQVCGGEGGWHRAPMRMRHALACCAGDACHGLAGAGVPGQAGYRLEAGWLVGR